MPKGAMSTGIAPTGSARVARRAAAATLAAVTLAAAGAGAANAIPEYSDPNFVTTLKCDSANPWPGPPLRVRVDVFNQIAFPSDGLPGPAVSLIGSMRGKPELVEYTSDVRVSWKNKRTGRTGTVSVPTRARTVTWQVDLHPGAGPVDFTIRQKIGALFVVPMLNPQYSTCRGSATA